MRPVIGSIFFGLAPKIFPLAIPWDQKNCYRLQDVCRYMCLLVPSPIYCLPQLHLIWNNSTLPIFQDNYPSSPKAATDYKKFSQYGCLNQTTQFSHKL